MTAVDQLEKEIYKWLDGRVYIPTSFFEKAKAMEERQIINAYSQGYMIGEESKIITPSLIMAEQYYEKVYGVQGSPDTSSPNIKNK